MRTVAIIDDQKIAVMSIQTMVERVPGMRVSGVFYNAADFFEAFNNGQRFDIYITDMVYRADVSKPFGTIVAKKVLQKQPDAYIIVVSTMLPKDLKNHITSLEVQCIIDKNDYESFEGMPSLLRAAALNKRTEKVDDVPLVPDSEFPIATLDTSLVKVYNAILEHQTLKAAAESLDFDVTTITRNYKDRMLEALGASQDLLLPPIILVNAIKHNVHDPKDILERIDPHNIEQFVGVLNERDLTMFRCMANGIKRKEIASQIGLTNQNTSLRVTKLKSILGVEEDLDLLNVVFARDLLSIDDDLINVYDVDLSMCN